MNNQNNKIFTAVKEINMHKEKVSKAGEVAARRSPRFQAGNELNLSKKSSALSSQINNPG